MLVAMHDCLGQKVAAQVAVAVAVMKAAAAAAEPGEVEVLKI